MLGRGIIRGFIETGRNFFGSYYDPARLVTVQYPEAKIPPQENARTVPFLIYDGADPTIGLRCTACTICSQECPAHCIDIVKDTAKKPDFVGKMQFQPRIFNIDVAVCMGCGICAEVCPFDSIKMDRVIELSGQDRKMILTKVELAKSSDYYRKIHPTEAAIVDAARAEDVKKAQAKKSSAPAPAPTAT